jgi:hypothetical protein
MLTRNKRAKYYQTRLWITSPSVPCPDRESPEPRDWAGATAVVPAGRSSPEATDSRLRGNDARPLPARRGTACRPLSNGVGQALPLHVFKAEHIPPSLRG